MVTTGSNPYIPAPPSLPSGQLLRFAYRGPKSHSADLWRDIWYMTSGELGADIETISLEDRTPLCIGLAPNPKESYYFHIDSPVLPWHVLSNPNITKIFHNGNFDISVLEEHRSGLKIQGVQDTILAAQLLGLPPKMQSLAKILFNRDLITVEDLIGPKGKNQRTMADLPEEKVALKVLQDAEVTIEAWWRLRDQAPKEALALEMEMLPLCMKMERRGILVDKEALSVHKVGMEKQINFYRGIAKAYGFNPGSSLQLAAVLQSRGWRVQYNRKTKKPILNEDILTTYYAEEPMAHLTLLYRKAQVLLSTYIKKTASVHIKEDGRVHPHFNQGIASTGRLTHTKPNSANYPESMRDIFIPQPGCLAMSQDLSQIELRVLAFLVWLLTGDKIMLDIMESGADIHQEVANMVNCSRRIAKDINFAVTYGGDAYTLYTKDAVPLDLGQAYIDSYFRRFPGVLALIQQTHAQLYQHGYTETLLGRRRGFWDKIAAPEDWVRRAAEREAFNHRVQGSAAEILKRWQLRLDYLDVFQVNSVHDETWDEHEIGRPVILDANDSLAPFRTPAAIKVGSNWRDLVEVHKG